MHSAEYGADFSKEASGVDGVLARPEFAGRVTALQGLPEAQRATLFEKIKSLATVTSAVEQK